MEYLISLFIDDEMNLDEKMDFVEEVHRDRHYKDEAVELIRQEKSVRAEVVDRVPDIALPAPKRKLYPFLLPTGLLASAAAAALVIILFSVTPRPAAGIMPYRFVIHQPEVSRVEIAGTFTNWQKLPLARVGSSGYWEINLNLPAGEHQFSYIVDGERRLADPTVMTREKDDFGGENSILKIEVSA